MSATPDNLTPLAEMPQHTLAADDALYTKADGQLVPVNYRQTLPSGKLLCDASGDNRVFTLTRSDLLIAPGRRRPPAVRPAPVAAKPAAPSSAPPAPPVTARLTAPALAAAASAPRSSASPAPAPAPAPGSQQRTSTAAAAPTSPRAAANAKRWGAAAEARALAEAIVAEVDRAAAEGRVIHPAQALLALRKRGLVPPARK